MRPSPDEHLPESATLDVAVADLARRWALARRAALRRVVPQAPPEIDERALFVLAAAEDVQAAHRQVFENSHVLGLGFRRVHRVDLTLVDLADVLPRLDSPCLAGGFARDEAAQLARTGREACAAGLATPGWCAHWREGLHGLVSGLSSTLYYTRVRSARLGGESCEDLLHIDAQSPARLVPAPAAMRPRLEAAAARVARVAPGSSVEFLGLVDCALHVRVTRSGPNCGPDLNVVLQRGLRRDFPELEIHDATPRAVLADSPH